MADIKTENIIYNIRTEKNDLADALNENARATKSLDQDVKETAKNSDKAFDTMSKSAKAYGERLQEAQRKQKQLSDTIREQERITAEFRNELVRVEQRLKDVGANTVQFQRLKKEADNLKVAIKENTVALSGLKIDKKQVDESVKNLQQLEKQAKSATGGTNSLKDAVSELGGELAATSGPFSNITTTLSRFGPLGIAAAAGIGAIGGAFLLANDRLEDFNDKVENVTERIRLAFNRAGDSIAIGFAGLFDANGSISQKIENFAENIRRSVTQVSVGVFGENAGGEISAFLNALGSLNGLLSGGKNYVQLRREAKELAAEEKAIQEDLQRILDFQRAAEDIEINNIVKKTELEIESARARREFEESRTEGIRNQEALNRLIAAEKELYELNRAEKEAQLKIEQDINELTLSRFDRENKNVQLKIRDIKLLEAEYENTLRTFEKLKRFEGESIKEGEKATEVQKGIIQALQERIAEQRALINQSANIDEVFALTAGLSSLEAQLSELEGIILAFRQRLDSGDPLELDPLTVAFGVKGGSKAFEDAFASVQNAAKAVTVTTPDILAKDQLKQEAQEALQIYSDLTRNILAQDVERKDRQIELQRERLTEFRRLAEQGNAEQLQLEEERLGRLIQAREQAAQRERQIASLQIAASNAVAIAEGIANVTKGFKDGPIVGIANAVALASTIGATILALRNSIGTIPAFAEGTEYVERNGAPKGKDTVLARVNEGERILTTEQNAKLKGISNSKLVEIATEYKLNNMRFRTLQYSGSKQDNSDILYGINRTNRLLEGLNLVADVNEYGLRAGISRADRSFTRKRNLAR